MEKQLGRRLSFNEIVHHIDGDKSNNELSNLEILSRSEHAKMHLKRGDILQVRCTPEGFRKLCVRNSSVTEEAARRIKYGKEKASILIAALMISKNVIHRIRCGKSWKHI